MGWAPTGVGQQRQRSDLTIAGNLGLCQDKKSQPKPQQCIMEESEDNSKLHPLDLGDAADDSPIPQLPRSVYTMTSRIFEQLC